MIRGYSKRQFAQSDFDATGYVFPTEEGVSRRCWTVSVTARPVT